jgi:hypothetical protein
MNENEGRDQTFLKQHDSDRRIGARRRFLCYVLLRATELAVHAGINLGGRMRSVLFGLTVLLMAGSAAEAACTCQCVDGQMQPVCDDAINPPTICPPTVCRPPKPSVAPVIPPNVLPLGGWQCKQARVCDTSGKCTWEQICR